MQSIKLILVLSLSLSVGAKELSINKVVIWGHKLHSHTHSYIHQSFYKTFKYLSYDTYWFDDADDVSHFDFSRALFIAEGQADKKIPIRNDCFYILHHCLHTSEKYKALFEAGRIIALEVYSDDVLERKNCIKKDECIYYDFISKVIYMPWATDLLPEEIDAIKKQMPFKQIPTVYWIGTIGRGEWGNLDQIAPFALACWHNKIQFNVQLNIEAEEHICLIQRSYMAPTIVGSGQEKNGYVPCRIFKNISYGQFGITNSKRVYELFDKKIIYNSDTYQLFNDARNRIANATREELYELMNFVKTKHTYINRINVLLEFLFLVFNEQGM